MKTLQSQNHIQNQIHTVRSKTKTICETFGTCSTCLKITPAEIFERDGKVFMIKECCTREEVLIENDAEFYKRAFLPFVYDREFLQAKQLRSDIIDNFGEDAASINISVTLKCNISCPICYNNFSPNFNADKSPGFELPLEKLQSILSNHRHKIVNLMGGEPTLREDLPEIIKLVIKSGNTPVLITNGLRLTNKKYVRELKEAGLQIVSISFDGFRDDIYEKLRGRKLLYEKLKALKNLKEEGMDVWLIPVIAKNVNEDQIPAMIKFALKANRFIKGIYFFQLYTGKTGMEEKITISDIVKIMERTVGIKVEQYIEEKTFRFNAYKLVKKLFSRNLSFLQSNQIYLKVEKGNFKPLFPLSLLRKLNLLLENTVAIKRKSKAILYLIKNMKLFANADMFKLAILFVSSGFDFPNASIGFNSSNVLRIKTGGVASPLNEDLERVSPTEELGSPEITRLGGKNC